MTRKDVVMCFIVMLWMLSNFASYFLFDRMTGVTVSNIFWIMFMCVMIVLKNKTRVGPWLERKI